jgi:hypothetical protein
VNSGLDRFQVEELESEYFELRNYPPHLLQTIREGLVTPEERNDAPESTIGSPHPFLDSPF